MILQSNLAISGFPFRKLNLNVHNIHLVNVILHFKDSSHLLF